MPSGLQAWNAAGELTYDSTTDTTLFLKYEQVVSGSSVGGSSGGITFSYPDLTGKKIAAFLQSPYGTNGGIDLYSVLSCRVTYPSGVPTVRVFVDSNVSSTTGGTLPISDGYLVVMFTGANQ